MRCNVCSASEADGAIGTHEGFLSTMNELVHAYHALQSYSSRHLRDLGLTVPQFDIIAILGTTRRVPLKELGSKAMIAKGTLTGIVDRLEQKGLIRRTTSRDDRRSFLVVLTAEGEATFERVFEEQLAYLKSPFEKLSSDELKQMEAAFRCFRQLFD